MISISDLQDQSIQGTETKTADEVRYETACARLANEAVLRLSADNVTVLLLAISKNTAASWPIPSEVKSSLFIKWHRKVLGVLD